jgi:hypothetical protein
VAFVVAQPGHSLEVDYVLAYCRRCLARVEVPENLRIVEGLSYTPKGALDRPAVAARYGR